MVHRLFSPVFLVLFFFCCCATAVRLPWEDPSSVVYPVTTISAERAAAIDQQVLLAKQNGLMPHSHYLPHATLEAMTNLEGPAVRAIKLQQSGGANDTNRTVPWEGAPVEALLLAGTNHFYPNLAKGLMEAAWAENITVYAYSPSSSITVIKRKLEQEGVSVRKLQEKSTVWLGFPVGGIWMRDYGPHFYKGANNKTNGALGALYQRPGDIDVARDFATQRADLPFTKLDLNYEWGNFQTNGKGLCIVSDRVASYYYSEFNKAGCKDLAVVKSLYGEGTGHVDMYMWWADPSILVMGVYTEAQDPDNHKIMMNVADTLQKQYSQKYGFRIEMIPMPSNCPRKGLSVPESCPSVGTYSRVYRSYTNLLQLNSKLVVPVYEETTTYEKQVLKIYAGIANGRYRNGVVPLLADAVIQFGGAIHCITKTVPKGVITSQCPTNFNDDSGVTLLCNNHGACQNSRCKCDWGYQGPVCNNQAL